MTKTPRPKVLHGETIRIVTGCGPMYVTINEDGDERYEVFISFGKGGGCTSTIGEAVGHLVALSLRQGCSVDKIIKKLSGISCHQKRIAMGDDPEVLSCMDALAILLKEHRDRGSIK